MLDRGEERQLDRFARNDGVLRVLALAEKEIGVGLKPGEVGRRQQTGAGSGGGASVVRQETPGPALEDPQASVRGDAVQPRAEGGLPPVRRPPGPRSEEALLERILRVLKRAKHPVGVNLELAAVALHELRERGLVSGDRGADGRLFRCVHGRGSTPFDRRSGLELELTAVPPV